MERPDTSAKVIVTKSKPGDFPSALRAKRSQVQNFDLEEVTAESITMQMCDGCGKEQKIRYYEKQLRSADEGSTVFYTCTHCGKKWNTNN